MAGTRVLRAVEFLVEISTGNAANVEQTMNRSNPIYRQLARNRFQGYPGERSDRYGRGEDSSDWEVNPEKRWIPPLTIGNQDSHPLTRRPSQNAYVQEERPKLIIDDLPIWLRVPLAIGFLVMIAIGSMGN